VGGDSLRCQKGVCDLLENAVQVIEYVVVPKSQDIIAAMREPDRSRDILRDTLRVLTAIDFDDKLCGRTEKVDDVGTDRDLATESVVRDLLVAKPCP